MAKRIEMKQAAIFLVIGLTLGLASCSQSNFGGPTVFDSLLASESNEQQTKKETAIKPTVSQKPQRLASINTDRPKPVRSTPKPKPKPKKSRTRQFLAGGVDKSNLVSRLNGADLSAASRAEYRALEYSKPGVATPWRNPKNGKYGSVVASDEFRQNNIYCRKYTHTIYINGRPNILRGFACRNRDGSWEKLG